MVEFCLIRFLILSIELFIHNAVVNPVMLFFGCNQLYSGLTAFLKTLLGLQEYWITYKYSGKAGESPDNPVITTKKSFLGSQFIRPLAEGSKLSQ